MAMAGDTASMRLVLARDPKPLGDGGVGGGTMTDGEPSASERVIRRPLGTLVCL